MRQSFFRIFCLCLVMAGLSLLVSACSERTPVPPTGNYGMNPPPGRERPSNNMPMEMGGSQALPPIQYTSPKTTVKIGLLLPLSGESAALGRSLQDAAVMALFDKYSTISPPDVMVNVVLVPKDTGSTPEQAAKAAREAAAEDVKLLIGPVFGSMVGTVAPIAREKNIPLISLSNNKAVAGNGVYIFGFMPEQQVNRVLNYALSRNLTKIGALLPQGTYGVTVQKAIMQNLVEKNLRLTPMEYYAADETDFSSQLSRVARVHASTAYPDGYRALFLAEAGAKLPILLQGLSEFGVNGGNVQFLGTGLWDDKDILRNPYLVNAWFASSTPEKYQAFESKFSRQYGYVPQRMAGLAYDAVALASSLAMAPNGPNFSGPALTDPGGFNGPANGIFRFRGNGICERGLAVIQITPQGFRVIDPAPDYFGG